MTLQYHLSSQFFINFLTLQLKNMCTCSIKTHDLTRNSVLYRLVEIHLKKKIFPQTKPWIFDLKK